MAEETQNGNESFPAPNRPAPTRLHPVSKPPPLLEANLAPVEHRNQLLVAMLEAQKMPHMPSSVAQQQEAGALQEHLQDKDSH